MATVFASLPAHADVPRGRYHLDRGGYIDVKGRSGVLSSCGQVAQEFIARTGQLDVRYSATAIVNSAEWIIDGVSKETVSIVKIDELEGYIVQIVLYETKGRRASGSLKVVALEGDSLRCADAVSLSGTFKR